MKWIDDMIDEEIVKLECNKYFNKIFKVDIPFEYFLLDKNINNIYTGKIIILTCFANWMEKENLREKILNYDYFWEKDGHNYSIYSKEK